MKSDISGSDIIGYSSQNNKQDEVATHDSRIHIVDQDIKVSRKIGWESVDGVDNVSKVTGGYLLQVGQVCHSNID